ncbi:MAG TPA: sugar phosphate isomerase/epimerase [Blastocatellia bacterium]|nr:sugar phosphate isomerase/epimerase [Blastocatellia bacterium]
MSNSIVARRKFLLGLGVSAAGAFLPFRANGSGWSWIRERSALPIESSSLLYPPVDLSYFDTPISPAPAHIRFGYAAITWGGDDSQAIKDISSLGFKGIQLRANILKQYGSQPGELKDILSKYGLEFVALSSGAVSTTPGREKEDVDLHTQNAQFLKEAGGRYLQVTDSGPIRPRTSRPDDFRRLGNLLTEIGQRVTDLGVQLGYHNHMGSLGQAPADVDKIMNEADSRYVKLELDVAHYFQGGGDPVNAIRTYRDRLLFLHLKDVEKLSTPGSYQFVELGKGQVDIPGVVAALEQTRFRGWAVVELDAVPRDEKASGRTPRDCAIENKQYLEEHFGLKIQSSSS